MKNYTVILREARTGKIVKEFNEIHKTQKKLREKYEYVVMFRKPKILVRVSLVRVKPGVQTELF